MARTKRGGQPQSMFDLLSKYDLDKNKYISKEWQDYAYRLAVALDDTVHTPIYMRIVKSTPRDQVERAKSFVMDAKAKSMGKMFMWKLKQIKEEDKIKTQKIQNSK